MRRHALSAAAFIFGTVSLVAAGCGDDDGGATSTGGSSSGGQGGEGAGATGGAGGSAGGAGGEGGSGGAGGGDDELVDTFFTYLTGRFDSSEQAASNPTYFAVQLYGCPVDAPELGERVLYIEQALLDNLAAPYRQRLYVVEAADDGEHDAVSRVYELKTPSSYVGLCDRPTTMTVAADDAVEREGCEVWVREEAGAFVGGTEGENCKSSLQGASYATSIVEVHADRIDSWDRGFDAVGAQVWGATAGPYAFLRLTPLPED